MDRFLTKYNSCDMILSGQKDKGGANHYFPNSWMCFNERSVIIMPTNSKSTRTMALYLSMFAVIVAVLLSNCGGGGSSSSGYGDGGGTTTASTVQVVACQGTGTTDVSIVSIALGFAPNSITVPVNTTVKWTNSDAMPHTVTSTTAPANGVFDVQVNSLASACLKFTSSDSFSYRCTIHPSMPTGVVIVQ
jgi:plastocyanin